MSPAPSRQASLLGSIGRRGQEILAPAIEILYRTGGVSRLLVQGLFYAVVAPFSGPRRLLRHHYPNCLRLQRKSPAVSGRKSLLMPHDP